MEPKVQFPQLQKYEGVMPSILTRDGLVSFPQKGKKKYPSGAVLHWDADIDAFSEQTGNHQYLSSILGPQYVRQADGTPVSIGAAAPVDTFEDGLVGLRSVGQVQNLLPTGAADSATWVKTGCTVSDKVVTIGATTSTHYVQVGIVSFVAGYVYTHSFRIKPVNGQRFVQLTGYGTLFGTSQYANFDLELGVVTYSIGGTAQIIPDVDGAYWCHFTATCATSGTAQVTAAVFISTGTATRVHTYTGDGIASLEIDRWMLSATAYPVPYVPPGITQPASNSTATGGSWFSIPVGSPVYNALIGGPMTLASVVRMGVGSADLPNSTAINLLACDDVATSLLRFTKDGGGATYLQLFDGTNTAQVACTVARYDRIQVAVQVLANGTQMRIGYRNLTTGQTAITWGAAATYRGTFGPDATLQRLMVGYGNAYPLWVEKLTTIPEQVSDARILEAAA